MNAFKSVSEGKNSFLFKIGKLSSSDTLGWRVQPSLPPLSVKENHIGKRPENENMPTAE